MEPKTIPFLWNAEVIVSRGPIDDPLFLNVIVASTMTDHVGSYGEHLIEQNCVNWLSDYVGEPVEAMSVVSLHWSMVDDEQAHEKTPPPSP